ncbi:MAG TPA: hypothetical protein VLH85_03880 [Levilinea sp.]|nr:hypothetical protein [Levilinea sp.]
MSKKLLRSKNRRPSSIVLRTALLALALCLLLPFTAQAQRGAQFERMQINIWPEYDRRSILVIYRFTLAAGTSLPAEITISIPAAAQAPFNLAFEDVDGLLYNLDYTLQQNGRWVDVSFTAPSLGIQLEYYDPDFEREGDRRRYEYTWPGNYAVNNMVVLVQQPVNATSMTISPDMGSGRLGPDGMTLFSASIGEVDAGRTFTYSIQYEKPDGELVIQPLTVRPTDALSSQTMGRTTMMELIPWVLGALGVLLISAGTYWYWRAGREVPEPARKRHVSARGKDEPVVEQELVYCHQCGKRAATGDAFCRTCGTKLQID